MPWSAVTEKSVWHPAHPDAGFAICLPCWNELGTTEARMPFYLMLPPMWASMTPEYADNVYERIERMRKAVIYTSERES